MQRQKTVAKWIAAVLLITVAIGGYVLFSAFYSSSAKPDGAANAGDSIDKPKPPIHIPYYTALPRGAETFNEVKISHTGGENDEYFLNSVSVNGKTFCFFSSESVEYDIRESGLHLAIIENNSVIKVIKFAGIGETLLDVKLCAQGVIAVTAGKDKNTLYLFSKDGEQAAKKEIPSAQSCKFYLNSSTLYLFAANGAELSAYKITDGLNIGNSEHGITLQNLTIKSVFTKKDGFVIVAENASEKVLIIEYNQNGTFKTLKQYINSSFVQFGCGLYDGQLTYFLLLKSDGKYFLNSLDATFSAISKTEFTVSNRDCGAAFFVYSDSLRLIINGYVYRFCRHLDLLEKKPAEYREGTLTSVNAGADNYFCTVKDGLLALYAMQTDFTPLEIFSEAGVSGHVKITTASGRVMLDYASSANTGKAQMNFGGFDVFNAEIPLT